MKPVEIMEVLTNTMIAYKSDLEYDKEDMKKIEGEFLWGYCATGTKLITKEIAREPGNPSISQQDVGYCNALFFVDGDKMVSISKYEALSWIDKQKESNE